MDKLRSDRLQTQKAKFEFESCFQKTYLIVVFIRNNLALRRRTVMSKTGLLRVGKD